MKNIVACLIMLFAIPSFAQENTNQNKFKQLGQELPTPNRYRNASGAPGPDYWQQQADYVMDITLDDNTQKVYGEETVTYHNLSPDALKYLWIQLDQNMRAKDSDTYKIKTSDVNEKMNIRQLKALDHTFDGGFKLEYVQDENGKALKHFINRTMMRIDLPKALQNGESFTFKIKWWYNINDRMQIGGRSGLEYFQEDDNYLYTIAQFFPRMCVYDDVEGWQNKQFLGRGEFALAFGNYEVNITVPADHLVSATGELMNEKDILSKDQLERLNRARKEYEQPVIIATQKEAEKREKGKVKKTKTWKFKADMVRDFAFASSRKFIWDAMACDINGKTSMAMSMYPKEGNPLWEQYSTKAVAHTLKWYSHYTVDYPYPVAWSIHAKSIGMEYPMICFNFGRPEKDGTYSKRTKYGMIGVIIHEVGHNFFPMIINSDERQWTWMDEGLNTFTQYLTEQQWERNYPSRRGEPKNIVNYMKSGKENLSPIMTNSESILQFGNNAYAKPATALNILRESVMGREAFDYAFKEYSNRWAFKHPTPADFFRTMEDASAYDLDWFWRGWFYTTDNVDISLDQVNWFTLETGNPKDSKGLAKERRDAQPKSISKQRNEKEIKETYAEKDPTLNDFYNTYDPLNPTSLDEQAYKKYLKSIGEEEKNFLKEDQNFYELSFTNKGGLVMPIIFQFEFTDGSTEVVRIPAEIWHKGQTTVSKVFKRKKEVRRVILDPFLETADVDRTNNYFPPETEMDQFELFKRRSFDRPNSMQKAKKVKKP
ncbi:M1 family metallopeptidase [Saprospiraceae bacterium]|nr:M1 family metallopeptidase [Saprospiraceae bacterium]